MKNCGDSPSKLQELILNVPSLPGTFATYDHVHTITPCLYVHRASTLNAQLPHLATRQPTRRLRSSWTIRPFKACANSWNLLKYTKVLRISAEWGLYMYSRVIALRLYTVLVSWHLHGWIRPSPTVDIFAKEDSLLNSYIQNENEFDSSRLG